MYEDFFKRLVYLRNIVRLVNFHINQLSAKSLAVHLKIHENTRIYECKDCVLSFKIQESYLNHLEKLHNFSLIEKTRSNSPRKFKCHICQLEFQRLNTLEMHLKRNHINRELPPDIKRAPVELINIRNKFDSVIAIRPYQCGSCKLKLSSAETLRAHIKIHQKKKYDCEICKISFSLEVSLKKHQEKHSKSNFECKTCKIPYKFEKDLIFHNRIHAKNGLVESCVYCEKRFSNSSDLINHERSHTKEKVYKCESCNKTFSYLNSLKKHKLTHTKQRDYLCSYCGAKFSSQCNLANHNK